MTEEESFKVYIKRELCARCRFPQLCQGEDKCSNITTAKGHYLAGLEAGKGMAELDIATVAYMQGAERYKPKWHKVADGDLPKNTRYVWTNVGASYYDDDRDCPCWRDEFGRTQGVIAWCEPKFEE